MASIGDLYHFLILSLIFSKERLNFKKYKNPLLHYSWATLETRNLGLKKPPIAWDFQSWSSSVVVESVLKLDVSLLHKEKAKELPRSQI